MATTNHERVGKGLELLKEGLAPFVARELQAKYGQYWVTTVTAGWEYELDWPEDADMPHLDVAALLRLMWERWNDVFRDTLGHAERSIVSELRETRNQWAHQATFTSDDADRALDSMQRLLTAISAPQADEVGRMKQALRRLVYEEQARSERPRSTEPPVETQVFASRSTADPSAGSTGIMQGLDRHLEVLRGFLSRPGPDPSFSEQIAPTDQTAEQPFDVAAYLRERGLEVIDKRPAGCLWVVGGNDALRPLMRDLQGKGVWFRFTPRGGKATSYRPGWWLK